MTNQPIHRRPASPVKPGAKSDGSEINPRFILRAVSRWWMVALPVGIVFSVVLCGLIWLLHEPVFESRSVVRISPVRPYVLEGTQVTRDDTFVEEQLSVIRSPMILSKVLASDAVAEAFIPELDVTDRETALAGMVKVKTPAGANFHYVTVQAKNKQHAFLLCDELMKAYFEYREGEDQNEFNDLIIVLQGEVNEAKEMVRRMKENYLASLKGTGAAGALVENGDAQVSTVSALTLSDLLIRQAEAEIQRSVIVLDIASLKQKFEAEPVSITDREVDALLESDSEIRQLKTMIAELRSKTAELLTDFGNAHPEFKKHVSQLEQLENTLKANKARRRNEIREEQLVVKLNEREDQLEGLELAQSRLDHEIQALGERIENFEQKVEEEKSETADLAFLRNELQQAEGVVESLTNRMLVAKIENRAPPRVVRLDVGKQASKPFAPVEAIPIKQMGVATFLAMVAPFLLAVLWEVRVRRVSDPKEVANLSEAPIIGEISTLPSSRFRRGGRMPKRVQRQLSQFEESVDSFRTSFLLPRVVDQCRIISVTSAVANEGKTTLATQFAMSIGRATHKRVLLIDADLRAPDIHRMFDLNGEFGLCDVLRGEVSIDDAVGASWDDDLFILPAGRLRGDSPHRLVGDGRFQELSRQLREKFDFVVVDTSPVLSSSEAMLIGEVCDDVIISVMRDVSRMEQVKRVQDRFVLAGIQPAGCVVSGVPQSKYAYSYGYYEISNT